WGDIWLASIRRLIDSTKAAGSLSSVQSMRAISAVRAVLRLSRRPTSAAISAGAGKGVLVRGKSAQRGYWRFSSTSFWMRGARGDVGSVLGSKALTQPPSATAELKAMPQAAVHPVFFSRSAFISVTDI